MLTSQDTLTMQIQRRTFFLAAVANTSLRTYPLEARVFLGGATPSRVMSSNTKKWHAHLTAANVSALFPQFVETVFGGTDEGALASSALAAWQRKIPG